MILDSVLVRTAPPGTCQQPFQLCTNPIDSRTYWIIFNYRILIKPLSNLNCQHNLFSSPPQIPGYPKLLIIISISSIINCSPWKISLALEGTLSAPGCQGSVPMQKGCSRGWLWPRTWLLGSPMQAPEPGPFLSPQSCTELWLGLPWAASPTTSQPSRGPGQGPADLGLDLYPWGDVLAWPQHHPHDPQPGHPRAGSDPG